VSETTSNLLVVFGSREFGKLLSFRFASGYHHVTLSFGWAQGIILQIGASTSEARVASIFNQHTLDFISHSEAQTRRLGARLGELLEGGETIALQGELGTGKTRWVQGVGQGLHVGQNVTSPTFTLVNEYPGRLTLYHVDLYRINQAAEALAFGLEDYLYRDGVCLIEWAERAVEIFPPDRLWITLHYLDDTKRRIVMQAAGDRYQELLEDFKRVAFGTRSR
jgi:tRNA threonylcarbamoyladenosine biosynthesis protein TsaE